MTPGDAAERPWEIQDKAARIAALAARYAALQAEGQDPAAYAAALAAAPQAPAAPGEAAVDWRFTLPHGGCWFGRIPRLSVLRAENPQGAAGVSLMLWSAATPSERMNVHDSQKVQWTTRLGRGRMLLSDMGRPLAQIVDDALGRNDALAALAPTRRDDATSRLDRPDARELFTLGAMKLGLTQRDLHPAFALFAPVLVTHDQRLVWESGVDLAGARADLQAAADLLAVVVNMPHAMAPPNAPRAPVELTLWRDAEDRFAPLRALTPETARAFAGWRAP